MPVTMVIILEIVILLYLWSIPTYFSSTVNLRLHGFLYWEILGLENGVRFHGRHFGPPTPKIRMTVSPKLFVSLASNFISGYFSWDTTFNGNFRKIEDLRAWPFGDITWNDPTLFMKVSRADTITNTSRQYLYLLERRLWTTGGWMFVATRIRCVVALAIRGNKIWL